MQWWNDFVTWFYSETGQQVFVSAIIPFVAIVLGGLIAALIGRGAVKRLVGQRDHETRAAAVSSLISAGQNAVRWHSQSPAGREHAERLASDADIQVRLLPIPAANLAADWAAHQLADMRINSVSFSFQAEQTLGEYRERLVLWLHKPSKARKLFAADLERWRYEDQSVDPLVAEQQKWAEDQFTATTAVPVVHEHEVAVPDVVVPGAAVAPSADAAPVPSADATPVAPTSALSDAFADRYATPLASSPATAPEGDAEQSRG